MSVGSVALVDLVDDAAVGTPDRHRVAIGHLHDDGYHLNQVAYVSQRYTELAVVTAAKTIGIG